MISVVGININFSFWLPKLLLNFGMLLVYQKLYFQILVSVLVLYDYFLINNHLYVQKLTIHVHIFGKNLHK